MSYQVHVSKESKSIDQADASKWALLLVVEFIDGFEVRLRRISVFARTTFFVLYDMSFQHFLELSGANHPLPCFQHFVVVNKNQGW